MIIKPSFYHKIMNPFQSSKAYWLWFSFFSIVFFFIYEGSYMNLLTWARGDDLLFFERAVNIKDFNWLGKYNSGTLSKVPGYSIFLAVVISLKIPYLVAISFLHIITIAFFLKCSMWLFKNAQLLSLSLGVSLLFNPIIANGLRIFRNQFSAICFIVFISVIITMFNPQPRRLKRIAKWAMGLFSFLGFAFLFYSREEQLLYFSILFLSAILLFVFRKHFTNIPRNLFLPAAGVAGILMMALSISFLNYKYYGRFITCEKTSKPYTSAIKAFHSVNDPDLHPGLPKATASYQKIQKIAEQAPVFEKAANLMCDPQNDNFKGHSTYLDRDKLEFEILDDEFISTSHFEWFWINNVRKSGQYRDAKETANYYNELAEGITYGLKIGKLKRREMLISAGPYFITKEDIPVIFRVYLKNFKKLVSTPQKFKAKYKNFTVRTFGNKHSSKDLTYWHNTLNANYLNPTEKVSIMQARNSTSNKAWNVVVAIFAFFMIPAMYLATPLAFFAFLFVILHKQWHLLPLFFILVSYYAIHLLMLSSIDVCVGYEGSKVSYFFPSYSLILITAFVSISTLISPFLNKNKKEADKYSLSNE